MAYSPQTQIKIEVLLRTIKSHPDWGASKLQKAVQQETGSQLRKQYLLKEAASFRASQKIESPRIKYNENRHLESILRKGHYADFEKTQFRNQIDRYSSQGRNNFIYSPTFEQTAKQHHDWIKGLLTDARKKTKNLKEAETLVYQRLSDLLKNAQYDPLIALKENEQAGQILSGMIRIRPLKRDYTDRRRQDALRKRELVREKVLRR